MSVYIDDAEHAFGQMKMCHMFADSTTELFEMVDEIGVARKWIQLPGTYHEHFDVCKSKRRLAVKAGAIEITERQTGERMRERRLGGWLPPASC